MDVLNFLEAHMQSIMAEPSLRLRMVEVTPYIMSQVFKILKMPLPAHRLATSVKIYNHVRQTSVGLVHSIFSCFKDRWDDL